MGRHDFARVLDPDCVSPPPERGGSRGERERGREGGCGGGRSSFLQCRSWLAATQRVVVGVSGEGERESEGEGGRWRGRHQARGVYVSGFVCVSAVKLEGERGRGARSEEHQEGSVSRGFMGI